MAPWAPGINAITLFVEDLPATKQFYLDVFDLPVVHEDDVSAVFSFGGTLVNLLQASEAPELIQPASVASPASGSRFQFTINVDDVDGVLAAVKPHGLEPISPPVTIDQGPNKGRRVVYTRDPDGITIEFIEVRS